VGPRAVRAVPELRAALARFEKRYGPEHSHTVGAPEPAIRWALRQLGAELLVVPPTATEPRPATATTPATG
jgi:hypothetical protein